MRRNLYIYGCACLSLVVLAALIFPQSGPVTRASAQEGLEAVGHRVPSTELITWRR